ncbi:MAG: hypothetical protein SVX43_16750, partial [Cyanobacteriota bacterium]|nr:hypothetical protein [Cyanobacteriota bacterium]
MSRRTSIEISQPQKPHPALAAALSCMDVQLETELARYRRQRPARGDRSATSTSSQTLTTSTLTADSSNALVPSALPSEQSHLAAELEEGSEFEPISQPLIPPQEELDEPAPDDYLESSERLLRDLDRDGTLPETAPEPTLAKRLFSPLGLSSMLLLLLAATMLGAAILDPGIISRLGVDRWFEPETTPIADETDSPDAPPETSQSPGSQQPPLETDEFVELELDNLSTIEPSPSPSVAALPSPAAAPSPDGSPVILPGAVPGNSSNLTRALISPTESAAPEPQPPEAESPTPQNVTVAPAPPTGDRFYYVTVNYSDVASLQRARTV